MKKSFIYVIGSALVIIAMILAGCSTAGVQNGQSPTSGQQSSTGKLEIVVTDAPTNNVAAVLVTIKSIEVHLAGNDASPTPVTNESVQGNQETEDQSDDSNGWTTITGVSNQEFNLFDVANNPLTLTSASAPAGNYSQVRMEVNTIFVKFAGDDTKYPATVPSGKIKFIQPFKVSNFNIAQLVFDFDAAKSVIVTGNDKVLFKPVIKLTVNEKSGDKETNSSNSNKETSTNRETNQGANTNQETNRATEENDNRAALQITTTALPSGTINTAYAGAKLEAAGGKAPYSWSISAGALPAGLALNSAGGTISGTPTASGDFNFTVKVTDSSKPGAKTSTQALTIHIAESGG